VFKGVRASNHKVASVCVPAVTKTGFVGVGKYAGQVYEGDVPAKQVRRGTDYVIAEGKSWRMKVPAPLDLMAYG
jgi:hypothetical protein